MPRTTQSTETNCNAAALVLHSGQLNFIDGKNLNDANRKRSAYVSSLEMLIHRRSRDVKKHNRREPCTAVAVLYDAVPVSRM